MKKDKESLSKKKILHLSWLAKIELSEEEVELFSKQLNEILSYFKKIDKAKVEELPPTYHVIELNNVLRQDEPAIECSEEILKTVPKLKGRYVKAPRIV